MTGAHAAFIVIGGDLPLRELPRFIELVERGGFGVDWEGTPLTTFDLPGRGPLRLMAGRLPRTPFRHIDGFCLTHGLSYILRSESFPGQWGPLRAGFTTWGGLRECDVEALRAFDDPAVFPIPFRVVPDTPVSSRSDREPRPPRSGNAV